MAILSFLESTLSAFRHCFNRTPAYRWFVVVICALMVRTDHLGVTSIIRALSLSGKRYESVIHYNGPLVKTTLLKFIVNGSPQF